jgi:hypothetical protein
MQNMTEARAKMDELEQRLRERGIVDVKFFKTEEFYTMTPLEQARDICEVIEAMLDGRYSPAPPIGDSVRVQDEAQP